MFLNVDDEILEILEYFSNFSDDTLKDMFDNISIASEFIETIYNNIEEENCPYCIDIDQLYINIEELYNSVIYDDNYEVEDLINLLRDIVSLVDQYSNF